MAITPKNNKLNDSKPAAMLYFHGGGCVIGSIETHDALCRFLANQSAVVIFSVGYRLAPEHKYPAAIIDAIEAWNWLQQNAESLGVDKNKCGVGGDSAGGYLAFVLGQSSLHSALPVSAESAPTFQYLLYPMLDLVTLFPSYQQRSQGGLLTTNMMSYFGKHFLNNSEEKKELLASPLLISEVKAIKTVVVSVEYDPLRDQALSLVEKLKQQKIEVKHLHLADCMHSFISVASVSTRAMRATESIAKELTQLVES
ncbi:MAG: alpha/beta hydrolase [Enterobacterales bacterium]|nr:alpha/beta hydrolase [Enterobacterales bacterium]